MMIRFYFFAAITVLWLAGCSSPAADTNSTATARYIETEAFAALNLPFSQAVRYGDILYVSGQIGDNEETGELVAGGIGPETRQTMQNIIKILEDNGSSVDQIIKCTCMLADIAEWAEMSEAYIQFFPTYKPARSAFGTTGLSLGARVEIECMAYVKD